MNEVTQLDIGDSRTTLYGWISLLFVNATIMILEWIVNLEVNDILHGIIFIMTCILGYFRISKKKHERNKAKLEEEITKIELENMQKNNNTVSKDSSPEG